MQLDIFEHSRDVMLRNDVLQALEHRDAPRARACWQTLAHEYPQDSALAPLEVLIAATATLTLQANSPPALADHAALAQAQHWLTDGVALAAQGLMAPKLAQSCLQPFWQNLIRRSAHLPYQAAAQAQHAAPMLLQIQDWQGAQDAVTGIESWRRIPTPLAWMVQARLNLLGLQANWALLAELAWLSPQRLDAVVQTSPDPLLKRLKDQFEAEFDASAEVAAEVTAKVCVSATEPGNDLAWFPAWVLTERPQLAPYLALAQPGTHSAPEQALRLLVNLLGLEHHGRHHDIVSHRKRLRDLHAGLYAAYMATR